MIDCRDLLPENQIFRQAFVLVPHYWKYSETRHDAGDCSKEGRDHVEVPEFVVPW